MQVKKVCACVLPTYPHLQVLQMVGSLCPRFWFWFWFKRAATQLIGDSLSLLFLNLCTCFRVVRTRQVVVSGPYKGVALVVLMDENDRRNRRRRSRSTSFAGSEDTEVTNLTPCEVVAESTSEILIWIFLLCIAW